MAYDVWQTCMLVPDVGARDCASWVQAWGSIGALGVAILVGRHQAKASGRSAQAAIKHNEQLLNEQRAERIAEAFAGPIAVAEAFACDARQLHDAMLVRAAEKLGPPAVPVPAGESFVPRELVSRVEAARAAFDAIPAHAVPGATGVTLVLELRQSLRWVLVEVTRFVNWLLTQWGPCPLGPELQERIQAVEGQIDKLRAELVRISQPL